MLVCACAQEDPAAISVEPASIEFDSCDTYADFEVVSTGIWSAVVDYSGKDTGWVSLSASSWTGSRSIRVSVSANDAALTTGKRQALVIFSTTGIGGTVKSTLNIVQRGSDQK